METNQLNKFGIIFKDKPEVQKCGACEKTFATYKGLQQHLAIHSDCKPYQCEVCAKQFRFKSNMYEHRSIHTGYQPHICPYCDKTFRLKGNMKKHMRTHVSTNEELELAFRPYAHQNNRSRFFLPEEPLNISISSNSTDQHEIKPRTARNLKLGQNATRWLGMLRRNELLPISTIEEKMERVKLAVFNKDHNMETLFEDCKSIEFEIYDCPFFKMQCRGKLACDSHIRTNHAKIREKVEWFCETCVRNFTNQNMYLQHQSYHTRIQLMIRNNEIDHVKVFDNPSVSIDEIAYHYLSDDFSNNNSIHNQV